MNTRWRGSRHTGAALRRGVMGLAAAGLLVLHSTVLFSQTEGPGGQERKSRPGEIQKSRTTEAPSTAPKMSTKVALPPVPISGNIEKMEETLARGAVVPAGEKQEPVDAAMAANPAQGKGEQKRKLQEAGTIPEAETHLRLVLQVTEQGTSEVVGATELPGPAPNSETPTGNFVVEVTGSAGTMAVQALPEDPFELRSFPGPEGSPYKGHHFERAKTARIVVDIPKTGLASPNLEAIGIKLYKIKPGAPLEKINPAELQRLGRENRLEMMLAIPGGVLGPQIREKGRKVNIQ